ncbi:Chitinase 2 [Nymphaea thermarum]|nr:Chitinase 2 [Nymphaea thermarum]
MPLSRRSNGRDGEDERLNGQRHRHVRLPAPSSHVPEEGGDYIGSDTVVTFSVYLSLLRSVLTLLILRVGSSRATGSVRFGTSVHRAQFDGVVFSDVPLNPSVDFHFILSFAINTPRPLPQTTSTSPPTDLSPPLGHRQPVPLRRPLCQIPLPQCRIGSQPRR